MYIVYAFFFGHQIQIAMIVHFNYYRMQIIHEISEDAQC